jgi:ribosomal protein L25 (general stress protein Ctc)
MNVSHVRNAGNQGRVPGVIVGQNMHGWEYCVTQSTILLNEKLVSLNILVMNSS